jgi:hypothetical protein
VYSGNAIATFLSGYAAAGEDRLTPTPERSPPRTQNKDAAALREGYARLR